MRLIYFRGGWVHYIASEYLKTSFCVFFSMFEREGGEN